MTLPSTLESFWNDQTAVITGLYEGGEISLAQSSQNIFVKSLILIAASFFESAIRDIVVKAINAKSGGDLRIISFCHRKGIDRQFHTWFEWKQNNANVFLSLFGDDFKKSSLEIIKCDEVLEKSVSDFMYIGRSRNELVHQNFLTYRFDDTADQTRSRIESALNFIKFVEKILFE